VQYLHGTTGATALEKALGPARLDELLRLLARVAHFDTYDNPPSSYNPRPVIQTINALQPWASLMRVAWFASTHSCNPTITGPACFL